MKKRWVILLCILLAMCLTGCAANHRVKETIPGNLKTYSQMENGTWMCEGHTYKYRLVIDGRMPNAVSDTRFVYLSNIRQITFEQAYKAAGISSNSEDYFPPEKAVLVDMDSTDPG